MTAIGCRCAASATRCASSPGGDDWSGRYPAIAVTATLLCARSFALDGEAVVCGPDGVAIFDALHRRGTVTEAMLYAFDLLELDGEGPARRASRDRRKRTCEATGRAPARHRSGGAVIRPKDGLHKVWDDRRGR
jgi:ATP-dependent DNA ligase